MLSKTWNPEDGRYVVTFDLPDGLDIDHAAVVGSFNDWDPSAHPMERLDDGRWATTVSLEPGRTHRFRYQLSGGEWENDWSADDYVPNEFGGADSVVDVPGEPSKPPAAKRTDGKGSVDERGAAKQAPAKTGTTKKAPAKKKAAAKTRAAKKAAVTKKTTAKKTAAKKTSAKKAPGKEA